MNTPKAHLLAVHDLKNDIPSLGDALTLLRVWANQRGYGVGNGMCVKGFKGAGIWWALVLEMLVYGEESCPGVLSRRSNSKQKPLGKGLSSYQLFKAALDVLGKFLCHI